MEVLIQRQDGIGLSNRIGDRLADGGAGHFQAGIDADRHGQTGRGSA